MPHLVQKYQDIEVGQVVTLNCGGPPMTVVGFVPSASPAIAPGIQNATYVDSGSALHAHVVWVAENGTLGQTTLPIGSFAVKDAKDDPKARAAADKQRADENARRQAGISA